MKAIPKLQLDNLKNLQNIPHTFWRRGHRDGTAHWRLAVNVPCWACPVAQHRAHVQVYTSVHLCVREAGDPRVQQSGVSAAPLVGGAEPLFRRGPTPPPHRLRARHGERRGFAGPAARDPGLESKFPLLRVSASGKAGVQLCVVVARVASPLLPGKLPQCPSIREVPGASPGLAPNPPFPSSPIGSSPSSREDPCERLLGGGVPGRGPAAGGREA